jgi:hypothetical protein
MSKQTAVEWLVNALELNELIEKENLTVISEFIEQAKAIEKEQIEENMAKAITFGWELSHYHRLKEPEVLLKMQKDFITSVIEGGDK